MNKFKLFFKLRSSLLWLFPFAFVCTSCQKDELTPETHTGANTLSCKINGLVYVASKSNLFTRSLSGGYIRPYNGHQGELGLAANLVNHKTKKQFGLSLIWHNINTKIKTNMDSVNYCWIYERFIPDTNKTIDTRNKGGAGQFEITYFDDTKSILSGTFNCLLIGDPNNSLTITEGRFDIKYDLSN